MKSPALLMAAIASVFVAAANAHATVIVTSGAGDGVAYDDWYVGPHSQGVFNQTAITAGSVYNSTSKYWNFAVLEFPLDTLAGQNNPQATLDLYMTQSSTGMVDVRYYGQGTGSIAFQDYLNGGSSLGAFDSASTGWKSLNVSSAIQDAVNHGYSWAVFSAVVGDGTSVQFATSENTGFGPRITVTPEPASLALFAFAALALLHRRTQNDDSLSRAAVATAH
jgi:hypothetical protein